MAAKKKVNLRALAAAPLAGFRHTLVTVPEWDNSEVLIREHSAGEWQDFRATAGIVPPAAETAEEGAQPAEPAESPSDHYLDAWLLAKVLMDPSGTRVFDDDSIDELAAVFGPVHMRLLNEAVSLGGLTVPEADAAKKG
ncbi:hypothetical protein GN155_017790 [Alcanivorax sp. ZXX171]|nr:hypothetical protein [Alcanivorax sp. ZXX171]